MPKKDSFIGEVRKYLIFQCNQNLPATFPHYFSLNLETKITRKRFNNCVLLLTPEFTNYVEKYEWFNGRRQSKQGLTRDQIRTYFPRKVYQQSKSEIVRQYLIEQYKKKLPATYAHFLVVCPNIVISPGKFSDVVRCFKEEFKDNPEILHWITSFRLYREILSDEEKKCYFPKKIVINSINELIRNYIKDRCNLNLPASYTHFLNTQPGTPIEKKQFNNSIYWLREEFDTVQQKQWMNEMFPYNPGNLSKNLKIVLNYFDNCFNFKQPTNWAKFHNLYPDVPYYTFESGPRKWRKTHFTDQNALDWFRGIRIQSSKGFTSKIGHFFDNCFVAELYSILKKRNIPLYHQTSSFVNLGKNPATLRTKKDRRVEVRLLRIDLLRPDESVTENLQ